MQQLAIIEIAINISIIVILTLPHTRIQHLLVVTIGIVVIHPVMDTLRLSQPLLVVLVKFTLLYTLIQLDIISLPQNSQHLVVDLTHSFIRIFNEFQDAHQNLPLIEDPLKSNSVEDKGVDAMQYLANKLGIVFLAQKQREHRLEQF